MSSSAAEKRPRNESSRVEARKRGGRRVRAKLAPKHPPPCPPTFRCHQCEQNHWTLYCPRIVREPHRYPKVDLKHGCYQCGQVGHNPATCPVKREKCVECGGMHNAQNCPYKYPAQEWHEFYDDKRQAVYYANEDTHEVTWDSPWNPNDTVFWHCNMCRLLMPSELGECVECHVKRPVTALRLVADEASSGDDDDEDGDSSSGSDSDSDSDNKNSDHGRSDDEISLHKA